MASLLPAPRVDDKVALDRETAEIVGRSSVCRTGCITLPGHLAKQWCPHARGGSATDDALQPDDIIDLECRRGQVDDPQDELPRILRTEHSPDKIKRSLPPGVWTAPSAERPASENAGSKRLGRNCSTYLDDLYQYLQTSPPQRVPAHRKQFTRFPEPEHACSIGPDDDEALACGDTGETAAAMVHNAEVQPLQAWHQENPQEQAECPSDEGLASNTLDGPADDLASNKFDGSDTPTFFAGSASTVSFMSREPTGCDAMQARETSRRKPIIPELQLPQSPGQRISNMWGDVRERDNRLQGLDISPPERQPPLSQAAAFPDVVCPFDRDQLNGQLDGVNFPAAGIGPPLPNRSALKPAGFLQTRSRDDEKRSLGVRFDVAEDESKLRERQATAMWELLPDASSAKSSQFRGDRHWLRPRR